MYVIYALPRASDDFNYPRKVTNSLGTFPVENKNTIKFVCTVTVAGTLCTLKFG